MFHTYIFKKCTFIYWIPIITYYLYIDQTDEGGGTSGRSSRGSDDDKLDRFLRSRLQRPHKPSASGDYSSHAMSPGFCKFLFVVCIN